MTKLQDYFPWPKIKFNDSEWQRIRLLEDEIGSLEDKMLNCGFGPEWQEYLDIMQRQHFNLTHVTDV